MMSVREGFVILLICFSMIGPVASQDLSDKILDFLSIYTGNWDNKARVEKGLTDHVLYQGRSIPVDIIALRPAATLFLETAMNGIIHILAVAVVRQESDDTISVTPYNFTDMTKYKPGQFGQFDPNELANITFADLHGDKTCTATYEFESPTDIVGEWSDCRHEYTEGKHPQYFEMINCDHFTAGVTKGMGEAPTRVPNELSHSGSRYPLVRAPATYISPCDKKLSD
uniref:Lipocalin/cytosolic fatty-acid binding domain-containing protein n=1 Tax=Arion vulgaris TaxID=1028688 RepID=A0A0B7AEU8_9EUPU